MISYKYRWYRIDMENYPLETSAQIILDLNEEQTSSVESIKLVVAEKSDVFHKNHYKYKFLNVSEITSMSVL